MTSDPLLQPYRIGSLTLKNRILITGHEPGHDSGYTFGCPVAPVILDDPDSGGEPKRICRDPLEEWTDAYRQAFARAVLSRKRANALARVVESAHEGLLLISRARRDASPLVEAAHELEALIETSMPAAPEKRRSSARRTIPGR